jgi:hypothetical protein
MAINLLALEPHKVSRDLSGYISYIYGEPKTGKTTLASQMDGALLLAFERGYNAIPGIIAQDITTWGELKQVIRELKKAEDILFHAYHSKKITQEELQTRLTTVLEDLDRKYPNTREFVTAYCNERDPQHHIALWACLVYGDEVRNKVRNTYFSDRLFIDLDIEYNSLYIDILKNVKIINYKEN